MMEKQEFTLDDLQEKVDRWIKEIGKGYYSELTNTAILMEEVGEVARLMSRIYGDQSFKDKEEAKNLADELADVMWIVVCLANQTGINLNDAMLKNIEKKTKRDKERHAKRK
jgi:NTP pyrophosphatase (non-canonical NTP hydrolase)